MKMKLFEVVHKFPTGLSHTVADGVVFPCGKAVVCWRGSAPSVAIYDSVADMRAVHDNDGDTWRWVAMSQEIGFEDWPL